MHWEKRGTICELGNSRLSRFESDICCPYGKILYNLMASLYTSCNLQGSSAGREQSFQSLVFVCCNNCSAKLLCTQQKSTVFPQPRLHRLMSSWPFLCFRHLSPSLCPVPNFGWEPHGADPRVCPAKHLTLQNTSPQQKPFELFPLLNSTGFFH